MIAISRSNYAIIRPIAIKMPKMTLTGDMIRLKRHQIDERLRRIVDLRVIRPRRGWIHTIRTALGMSQEQLAKRLGLSTSAVGKLEKSEEAEAIELRNLRKVANAMECDLVIALVPRRGSLEETVLAQAREKARTVDARVLHTMALERQSKGIDWDPGKPKHLDWWATENLRRLWD
jgi:predicted DNA-binding mobile mystery protein A